MKPRVTEKMVAARKKAVLSKLTHAYFYCYRQNNWGACLLIGSLWDKVNTNEKECPYCGRPLKD